MREYKRYQIAITINYIKHNSNSRLQRIERPLVEGCIKQRCGREYSKLSDLIHNDRSFVNFKLFLVKIVMYLLIFISDVNVV